MSRPALLFVVLLVLAGCVGGPGSPSPTDSSVTETVPTGTAPTEDAASPSPPPHHPVRVHHVLGAAGHALSEFRSVNVTVRSVAFREGTESQCHGPLYPEDATLTPTKTPDPDAGVDCVVFRTERTLDLTAIDGGVSLGAYTVPAVVADDTFVVVTPRNGTLKDGTTVTFAPDDPGFLVEPTHDGDLARVGLSVERDRSGYGVGPGTTDAADSTPAVEYAVGVDGRIRNGESVTVSLTRNGEPLAEQSLTVGSRSVRTNRDGSVAVEIENARVFGIEVPVNASSASPAVTARSRT